MRAVDIGGNSIWVVDVEASERISERFSLLLLAPGLAWRLASDPPTRTFARSRTSTRTPLGTRRHPLDTTTAPHHLTLRRPRSFTSPLPHLFSRLPPRQTLFPPTKLVVAQ